MYHKSVLLNETIEGLITDSSGTYVDATFGGGGHSREVLNRLDEKGLLYSFDQDPDSLQNLIDDDRFTFIGQNFKYLKNFIKFYNADPVDGIMADLGVSSYQFDTAERGFSFRFDGPLDFRMNPQNSKNGDLVINEYSEEELSDIFFQYGELRNARQIARHIVKIRKTQGINTTFELIEQLKSITPRNKEHKFLAQLFQAIRIEVNDELEVLKDFLLQSSDILKSGGRLAVITFHSLEDRIVKNFFKSGNFKGEIEKDFYGNPNVPFKLINRKPITATEEELEVNNRSRSAKLRVVEKI
ncbi:MAG: 16S rRNA (cytosine(1402)-N(4))-methyltransferase RsmH [Hyphomicrobiales bacterium]